MSLTSAGSSPSLSAVEPTISAKTAETTKSQRTLVALGIATIGAHLLAALALLPWYSTIFVFGLIQQLFVAALNFVLLLFPLRSSA